MSLCDGANGGDLGRTVHGAPADVVPVEHYSGGGGMVGGFACVNSGPDFGVSVARAVALW
ncbi:hypothetical protein ACFOJ6_15065 [Gordonia humi]|uniref:hypothetical protein n=1 Tax=Gordonia humi TaxID=686429 RepID=UPI003607ECD5